MRLINVGPCMKNIKSHMENYRGLLEKGLEKVAWEPRQECTGKFFSEKCGLKTNLKAVVDIRLVTIAPALKNCILIYTPSAHVLHEQARLQILKANALPCVEMLYDQYH